jgi:hypothetical protein
MTFAGTHPRITDGAPLTAGELVGGEGAPC